MLPLPSGIHVLRPLIIPLLALTSASFVCRQAAAEGEFRALLVGVSAYENPLSFKPLLGPANDVALMRATLLERGFSKQNIVMLADRPDAASRPTRDAIIQELDRLAERVERDDMVLIHLAGHGSQQPNGNPDEDPELDGLDEIFLPADAGLWVDEMGTVSKALVDDEIATKLAAIRGKGAFVFFVSDSCHAETLTRAGAPVEQGVLVNERSRYVSPEQLGIPKVQLEEAMARASRSRGGQERTPLEAPVGDGDNIGGFVAFYAAQSTEEAPEMPLPPGAPDADENWYGLFSFNLASALAASSGVTYRQAFEQVLQSYRADNRFVPTPISEGPDLNRLVFGGGGIEVRQWPIATDGGTASIPVGALHQVSEGTIVAIVPSATTVDEADFLGYARVADAEIWSSSIEPVAYADRPALAEIPAGAFARIVDSQFETRLAVALAEPPATPPTAEASAWRELGQIRTAGLKGIQVEWVPEAAPSADLRLLVRDGRLWFLPPSGELVTEGPARTSALTIPAGADEAALSRFRSDLEDNLRKVARVTTLFALARKLTGNELARGLEIKLEMRRRGTDELEELSLADVPQLHDGDVLTFRATNNGQRPVDLTVLFVDSRYSVEPWFPYAGEVNRVRPGETVTSELVVNLKTVGIEHWIFIAAAVEPATPVTNFAFLAQEGLVRRSGAAAPRVPDGQATILDLLLGAGLPDTAVRGGGRRPVALAGAAAFSWNVVAETSD